MMKWGIRMQIGTTLTLRQSFKNSQVNNEYKCQVIDKDDHNLVVDLLIDKKTGKTVFFEVGTHFNAIFIDKNNNLYQFKTQIIGKTRNTVRGLVLRYPEETSIKHIQRREYVRVETAVDIAIASPLDNFSSFTTVSIDISGGGVSVVIPDDIIMEPNEICEVCMVLTDGTDNYDYVHAKGRIIHIHQQETEIHTASIKFIEIGVKEQQKVIQHCFQKQREIRRKELL